MKREIVINSAFGETRAAFLEDRRLVELYVEREPSQRVVGNIYKGRVENVLPGMQAAFVNIGLERNAFLYVDDALHHGEQHNGHAAAGAGHPSIRDILKEGDTVVVQVTKEPLVTKGARVVTNLSVPGRYFVWLPGQDYIGISRRIADEAERSRLRSLAKQMRPEGVGLIVRTEAQGRSEHELLQDVEFLSHVWSEVEARAERLSAPALLYKDYDLIYRIARDRFTDDVDKLVVDDSQLYRRLRTLIASLSPELSGRVYLYHEGPPIFEAYGIEDQIDSALDRKVWLDCGGYLVIDHTEALTSIDVNTGRFIGTTNLADTVLRTNLEASVEIARQLRLRDIGGIIIVDFIDMESKEDEEKVLRVLEQEVSRDRTRTHILGFTNLGLVEITRKKVRRDIEDVFYKTCPTCHGSGQILSETTVAYKVQREIKRVARATDDEAILVACHPSVAAVIIGSGGANLRRLEEITGKTVFVRGTDGLDISDVRFVAMGTRQEVERLALPVYEGQVLDIHVEEPHVSNPRDGIARVAGYVLDIEGAGEHVGEKLQVEITRVFRTYAKGRMVGS